MNCPKCGSEVLQGHRYCSNCGYELTREEWEAAQEARTGAKKWPAVVAMVVALSCAAMLLAPRLLRYGGDQPARTEAPALTVAPIDAPVTFAPVDMLATVAPTDALQPAAMQSPQLSVRSREELYGVVNYMRDEGISKIQLSELSLSSAAVQEVIFDYVGVKQYTYAPGRASLEIEWYPGMRIWNALRSGTESGLEARDREIAKRAREVVDTVIAPGMSDLQKEIALHDYIIYHADYLHDETLDTDSVYGFFERGLLQCAGYVDTFYLLGRMAGLEVACVSGNVFENSEPHSWSLVRLDGLWYAVDATWDDPEGGMSEHHIYLNIPHRFFEGLRGWEPLTLPDGAYAQALDANWYYADTPRLAERNAAVTAAEAQLDQSGEAMLLLEGGLQASTVAQTLAARYQCTIWTTELLEESWARIYRFSFTQ